MSQIPNTPEQVIRVLQIITGALVMGVLPACQADERHAEAGSFGHGSEFADRLM